jgi:hypothetical protein
LFLLNEKRGTLSTYIQAFYALKTFTSEVAPDRFLHFRECISKPGKGGER